MGSIGIAAAIARVAFVALVVIGIGRGAIGSRAIVLFLLTGIAVWSGLPILPGGEAFVTPALAMLDVALVLAIFKGDVRLG